MSPELQEELFNKYPSFFADKDLPPTESCLSRGIECNDGWFHILKALCFRISQEESFQKLYKKEPYEDFKFKQIKEKFGVLRIYSTGGDNVIRGAINMAEDVSNYVCEDCGQKGSKTKNNGWIRTLCEKCDSKITD